MRGRGLTGLCAFALLLPLVGCASSARLVKWDQDGGIVAIPSNTNYWPNRYREQAEDLMQKKCPKGYEIVREEEVAVGQTARTHTDTDTQTPPAFLVGGDQSSNSKNGKTNSSGAAMAVPLGETRAVSDRTTTYQDITEYRIWFRPK